MNVITWNFQRGRRADGSCSAARAVDELLRLADADILCLQEVSSGFIDLAGSDGANQFIQLSRMLSGYTAVAGIAADVPGLHGQRQLFGNMIFSRFPVHQVWRHVLPWPADGGVKSMQRSMLEACLATPLGLVRVATTHLEYFSSAQRAAQVERLRELHRDACHHAAAARPGQSQEGPFEARARGTSALLSGDFNFLPGAAEYARMLAPIGDAVPPLVDAWRVRHPTTPHAPTVGLHARSDDPPFTFDYVFTSADLAPHVQSVRVLTDIAGPDHQPLLVELA